MIEQIFIVTFACQSEAELFDRMKERVIERVIEWNGAMKSIKTLFQTTDLIKLMSGYCGVKYTA